jgi:hypothetical protein
MTQRQWEWITAAAGLAIVALSVAALANWGNPQYTDPLNTTRNFYVTHRSQALLSVTLFVSMTLPLLAFAAGLRNILRRAEGEVEVLSTMAFGAAVATFCWLMVFGAVNAAIAVAAGQASAGEIRLFVALEFVVDQLNFLVMGVFVLAASLAVVATRALPRWIGWIGVLGGTLLVVSNITMLDPTSTGFLGRVSNIGVIGQLLFMIWTIAVSVRLILRPATVTQVHMPSTTVERALG